MNIVIVAVTSDDFRMSSSKIWREIENYTTAQLKYITRVYNNRFTKQRETRWENYMKSWNVKFPLAVHEMWDVLSYFLTNRV